MLQVCYRQNKADSPPTVTQSPPQRARLSRCHGDVANFRRFRESRKRIWEWTPGKRPPPLMGDVVTASLGAAEAFLPQI